jgi:hypothetical protein
VVSPLASADKNFSATGVGPSGRGVHEGSNAAPISNTATSKPVDLRVSIDADGMEPPIEIGGGAPE